MINYYINSTNDFIFNKENSNIYFPNVFFNSDVKNKIISQIDDVQLINSLDCFLKNFDLEVLKRAFITAQKTYLSASFSDVKIDNIITKLNSYEDSILKIREEIKEELKILEKQCGLEVKGVISKLIDAKTNISKINEANENTIKFLTKQSKDKKNKSKKTLIESHLINIDTKSQSFNKLYQVNNNIKTIEIVKEIIMLEKSEQIFEKYIGNKIIKKQNIEIQGDKKDKELRIDNYFKKDDFHYIIDFKLKHECSDGDLYKQIIYSAFLRDKKKVPVENVIGLMIKPYNKDDITIEDNKIYSFLGLKIFIINYPVSRIFNHDYKNSEVEIANIVQNYMKTIDKYKNFKLVVE